MNTTPAARPPSPLRFSLSHLFAVTTLAAIALAATFGPRWDADERWIIGSWFIGAIGLTSISRARGRRGVLAAFLGGGLLPGAVALAFPVLGSDGPVERVVLVTIFVSFVGGLLGAFGVLAFEKLASIWRTGLVLSLVQFLSHWRPPPRWTGIPIGLGLAVAWLATCATWHPRVTIEFYGSPEAAPDLPVATRAEMYVFSPLACRPLGVGRWLVRLGIRVRIGARWWRG